MPNLNCTTCGGTGVADYDDRAAGCPDCNVPLPKLKRKMKRYKGVNKQSEKTKERNKTHIPLRRALKKAIGYCDYCGRKRTYSQLEEHHVGRNRHRETMNPRRCLYVCADWLRDCHKKVDDLPVELQCQLMADAGLRAVNRCKSACPPTGE